MDLREIGPADPREVRAYQVVNGLFQDGKLGNQTFGHALDREKELEAELATCRQPDDPGPVKPKHEHEFIHGFVTCAILAMVIVAIGML